MAEFSHICGTRFVLEERSGYLAWSKQTGANAEPALRHLEDAMFKGSNIEMSDVSKQAALDAIKAKPAEGEAAVNLLSKVRKALGETQE